MDGKISEKWGVSETLPRFVPNGFLDFSSYEQVTYKDKEKTDNENQGIILKHAIRNCHYANHTYQNYRSFVGQYIYDIV